MLLQDTGMRIGENLSLEIDNIDFKHKMILVTKTKSRRESGILDPHRIVKMVKIYESWRVR